MEAIDITTRVTAYSYSSLAELDTADSSKKTWTIDHTDVIHCVILATIGILAVCTNCLSFLIMFRCRWWHQKSIIILASLAVADIISGLTSPAIMYSWYLLPSSEYTLHVYVDAIGDFPIYVSVCHIVLIAVDRFIAISFPLRYGSLMSSRRVAIALVIVWSMPLLRFAVLPLADPGDRTQGTENTTEEDDHVASGVTLYSILEITIYLSVLLLIVYMYGRLWFIARKQIRSIRVLLVREQSDNNTRVPPDQALKTSKANKTCGCILTAYVGCWMPFLIVRLVEQARGVYDPENMSVLLEFLLLLCRTSSCVNFFIYTWTSSRFRLAYKRILSCQKNVPSMMAESTEMTLK